MKENQRLKEIINEWLQIKKITLKESTYYGYVYQINQYIIPYFKDISMQELEKYDSAYQLCLQNRAQSGR